MAQLRDRPIGKQAQIAMFPLGSVNRYDEVRMTVFRDDEWSAAKSEFDLG